MLFKMTLSRKEWYRNRNNAWRETARRSYSRDFETLSARRSNRATWGAYTGSHASTGYEAFILYVHNEFQESERLRSIEVPDSEHGLGTGFDASETFIKNYLHMFDTNVTNVRTIGTQPIMQIIQYNRQRNLQLQCLEIKRLF